MERRWIATAEVARSRSSLSEHEDERRQRAYHSVGGAVKRVEIELPAQQDQGATQDDHRGGGAEGELQHPHVSGIRSGRLARGLRQLLDGRRT